MCGAFRFSCGIFSPYDTAVRASPTQARMLPLMRLAKTFGLFAVFIAAITIVARVEIFFYPVALGDAGGVIEL